MKPSMLKMAVVGLSLALVACKLPHTHHQEAERQAFFDSV